MKHIFKKIDYVEQNNYINSIFDESSIFFDIETTGFSPATSTVYLIGCLRKQGDELIIDQFFAENKEDEKEVLEQFLALLSQSRTIISFNGIGFDLPFIKAKCVSYGISYSFSSFGYIDIFKEVNKEIENILMSRSVIRLCYCRKAPGAVAANLDIRESLFEVLCRNVVETVEVLGRAGP